VVGLLVLELGAVVLPRHRLVEVVALAEVAVEVAVVHHRHHLSLPPVGPLVGRRRWYQEGVGGGW
jgi:hypothetical protein